MNFFNLFMLTLFSGVSQLHAQIKVEQITYKANDHFITTNISGYPITGIYYSTEKKEPTIVLNPDGIGIYQRDDLTKKNIIWGIECTEEGVPISKAGFNSATYTFWYKTNDNEGWVHSQFSIHFNKKKMYLMGERVKEYDD